MEWIKYSLVYTGKEVIKNGRFDSKIRFEIESDGRFDSRFDSNAKKTIRRSLIFGRYGTPGTGVGLSTFLAFSCAKPSHFRHNFRPTRLLETTMYKLL